MITQLQELSAIRARHRSQVITLALGSFDIIHFGHIQYLEWAKRQGDVLVVSLKSDSQIAKHKGLDRPVVTEQERVAVVDALKNVDYSLVGAAGDLYEAAVITAKMLQPDVVVLGPDWGNAVKSAWEAEFPDTTILVAPHHSEQSTSSIIHKIRNTPEGIGRS